MRLNPRFLFATLAVLAPLTVKAGGLPADHHTPPLFLDEPQTTVFLRSRDQGYQFEVATRIVGLGSNNDRARVDWKQRGKVVATAACSLHYYAMRSLAVCTSSSDTIMAKGAVDAQLIVTADEDGMEYLVRTFKLNVYAFDEGHGTTLYQILPDDTLGAAWVRHNFSDNAEKLMPLIEFWMATSKTPGKANMRCTVDGKKLDDIDASIEPLHLQNMDTDVTLEQEADHFTGKAHQLYHYEGHSLDWNVVFGPKTDALAQQYPSRTFLIDHPGKWDCLLRDSATGKTVREFLFSVNGDGIVEQNDIQSGEHAIATLPNVVLIEVRLPKDNPLGERIRPDLMKKSLGFGLPWPDHPHVKAIQAAFPPASGLAKP